MCASAGLTKEGQAMLESLRSGTPIWLMPQGAMPTNETIGSRVVVVSLFDGIAALMVAL